MLALFIITGIGIVVYSNQPPLEPRERGYVLVGSIMAFAIWIGLAVPAIYERLEDRMSGQVPAIVAGGVVMIAPLRMGFNDYDDHNRRNLHRARASGKNCHAKYDENQS